MDERIIISEKVTKKAISRPLRFLIIIAVLEAVFILAMVLLRSIGLQLIMSFGTHLFGRICMTISNIMSILAIIGLLPLIGLIIKCVVAIILTKCEITVTTNRVYGHTWMRQVNIPIDSITDVRKGKNRSVTVAAFLNKATFSNLDYQDEIFEAISNLLKERRKESENDFKNRPGSVSEELKEYKAMLDAGIITQEEFDAKKKQLLGL